jgi:branched-chain amino acid transport system substrate-binding protein
MSDSVTARRRLLAGLAAMAALAVGACQLPAGSATSAGPAPPASATDTPPAAGTDDTPSLFRRRRSGLQSAPAAVRLGVVLSTTGPAASIGVMQDHGVRLAVEEINATHALGGAKLAPIYADDGSDKPTAVDIFRRLIETDHVLGIIGPTQSNTAFAADPIAQQAGVPVLAVSNAAGRITDIGSFVFRCSLSERQLIPSTVAAALARHHVQRAAILYGDDAATRLAAEAFKRALGEHQVPIVAEQSYPPSETDIDEQLATIRDSGADGLFLAASVADAGAVAKRIRGAGLTLPLVGSNAFNAAAARAAAEGAAEGLIVGSTWSASSSDPRSQAFARNYRGRWGQEPDQFAAQAYAGVYILAQGVRNAGTVSDTRAFRDGLAEVRNLDTVLGRFSFTDDRDADATAVVHVVRDGALVPLG